MNQSENQPNNSLESRSLPSWVYHDQDFFDLEREKVFMPAWHLACHSNDIPHPGDYSSFSILGELAIIVRDKNHQIHALHNVCRHRAARLLDGNNGNCGKRITCPYHGWSYQLDGTLSGVPELDSYENLDLSAHNLRPIETAEFAGFIFIRFVPGGSGIDEYMAPIAPELAMYRTSEMHPLRSLGTRVREVNWKNATDNYVDALHIRVAHAELNNLLGGSYRLEIDQGVTKIFSDIDTNQNHSLSNQLYRKILPKMDHLPAERQRMWTYYKLWPNLMFDIYPEQIDFMQFIPLTPTRCLLRECAYALPDARREVRVARYLNWRINRSVNQEDQNLIERVQDGMQSSSFKSGPLGNGEISLRHFAQQLRSCTPIAKHDKKPSGDQIRAGLKET